MSMKKDTKLDSLHIYQPYGAREGEYSGNIRFTNTSGNIELKLTSELSHRILEVVAEDLIDAARETAEVLTAALEEDNVPALMADEPVPEIEDESTGD